MSAVGRIERSCWLSRVALGDRDAFEALFRSLDPKVRRHVAQIVLSRTLAEEVTQEVWLEVLRVSHRFRPARGSAEAWILTIATRRAIDCVRHENRLRDRVAPVGSRPEVDIAETVAARESCRDLHVALGRLTRTQREAVVLTHLHGGTTREVAIALGVPHGTLKTRVNSALASLRRDPLLAR